jgi:DNA invertase Pin-like site-specific DNA recombinase
MTAHKGKFVAYYRVSTDRQGKSGLGLEAQQKAVRDYLNGGDWTLVGEFTEVETGKHEDRPELTKALALCKKHKARLVIAKLDRLSRNLAFIAKLMDAGAEFTAVDNPHANKLTVHILAAVAQHEREMIGERTKAALQAAKARGVKLGRYGAETLAPRYQQEALQRATKLKPVLQEMLHAGLSFREIAKSLTDRQVPTPRGGAWHPQTISRTVKRLGIREGEKTL